MVSLWMVYWTPICNPLTSWERAYVGVPGISLSLYLFLPTPYPYAYYVWRLQCCARLHHILILLSSLACVHTSTLVLVSTIQYCLALFFSMYVYHTYLYTYYVCAPVYYTVHAPYHYVVLCRILHVTTCAPKYTYTIHISTSITHHLVCHHLIFSSYDTCVSSPTVPVTWHMPFHAL